MLLVLITLVAAVLYRRNQNKEPEVGAPFPAESEYLTPTPLEVEDNTYLAPVAQNPEYDFGFGAAHAIAGAGSPTTAETESAGRRDTLYAEPASSYAAVSYAQVGGAGFDPVYEQPVPVSDSSARGGFTVSTHGGVARKASVYDGFDDTAGRSHPGDQPTDPDDGYLDVEGEREGGKGSTVA